MCNALTLKRAVIYGNRFFDMQSELISASDHNCYNNSARTDFAITTIRQFRLHATFMSGTYNHSSRRRGRSIVFLIFRAYRHTTITLEVFCTSPPFTTLAVSRTNPITTLTVSCANLFNTLKVFFF